MTDYMPPDSIHTLFETEELATSSGRATLLEWVETLDLKSGDRIYVPAVLGDEKEGWYEYDALPMKQ